MKSNPPSPEEYDIVILGTGEGAKYAAWTFARQGKRVAAIDRKYIGGSCPNIACLPSKSIIQNAKVASYFRRSEEFGIIKDNFTINMSAVRDRKRKMVHDLVDMHNLHPPHPAGRTHLSVFRRTSDFLNQRHSSDPVESFLPLGVLPGINAGST